MLAAIAMAIVEAASSNFERMTPFSLWQARDQAEWTTLLTSL
jgi:hypothetical protein